MNFFEVYSTIEVQNCIDLQYKRDNMDNQNEITLREELAEATKKLDILMENMPGGVIIYEAKTGKILEVSKSLLDMFGCTEKAFREHYYNCFDLMIYKSDRPRIKDLIEQQMAFLTTIEVTFRARDLMGERKFLDFKGKLVTDKNGVQLVYAILSDVSERMLVQQELQRMNETLYMETQRYKLLMEAVDDIPFDYNALLDSVEISLKKDGGTRVVIDDFHRDYRYKNVFSPDTVEQVTQVWDAALMTMKKGSFECKLHLENDKPYEWYRIHFVSFQDKTGRIVRIVGSAKNIMEEKLAEEEMNSRLKQDSMTGLYNKTTMESMVNEFILSSMPTETHALFLIDADNFKAINDNLGHMYGDEVIRFVAKTIRDIFRDSDYVGRIGGDEFMVFMKNATKEVAMNRAAALNEAMRKTFEKDGISITISCSIGVALYSKDGADYTTLFTNADACLYEAKRLGKDQSVFCQDY